MEAREGVAMKANLVFAVKTGYDEFTCRLCGTQKMNEWYLGLHDCKSLREANKEGK